MFANVPAVSTWREKGSAAVHTEATPSQSSAGTPTIQPEVKA